MAKTKKPTTEDVAETIDEAAALAQERAEQDARLALDAQTYFSSESAYGFYNRAVHGDAMPSDAKPISLEKYNELMDGQNVGRLIVWVNGEPELQDHPPPTPEELAATERGYRDAKLAATDGLVARHRDEIEDGADTTLSLIQYSELQEYRRALRAWPKHEQFPDVAARPVAPSFIGS